MTDRFLGTAWRFSLGRSVQSKARGATRMASAIDTSINMEGEYVPVDTRVSPTSTTTGDRGGHDRCGKQESVSKYMNTGTYVAWEGNGL